MTPTWYVVIWYRRRRPGSGMRPAPVAWGVYPERMPAPANVDEKPMPLTVPGGRGKLGVDGFVTPQAAARWALARFPVQLKSLENRTPRLGFPAGKA